MSMEKRAEYPSEGQVSNNHVFQWTQAIHRDLSNLRDNHLAHMAQDITSLKHDVASMKNDIDELKSLKAEAISILRRYSGRIVLAMIAAVGATIGAPMAVDYL
jgi:hypothetical protein